MLHNVTKEKCMIYYECKKFLQNVTYCRCLIHEMLRNAEAETTEVYEVKHKLYYCKKKKNT